MPCLSVHLVSKIFGRDKQNRRISETLYYAWYQDGFHLECTDHETIELLTTVYLLYSNIRASIIDVCLEDLDLNTVCHK